MPSPSQSSPHAPLEPPPCRNHSFPSRLSLRPLRRSCQIEEAYIGAEDFCRQLNQDPKAVLNNEVALLQGLRFDLIVHSPYRALTGLLEVGRRG